MARPFRLTEWNKPLLVTGAVVATVGWALLFFHWYEVAFKQGAAIEPVLVPAAGWAGLIHLVASAGRYVLAGLMGGFKSLG
ncbi:MAG: hypothetical protein IRZ16_11010, partial [Myxococcaceae bacterium]|nr:hypothetical protein [Myxococcaceae bacterium]